MRVGIIDYGAGNLYSIARAVSESNAEAVVTANVASALECDALVLPGVGAFGSAASFLAPYRSEILGSLASGLPCLGICLGMQLLFESSEEGTGDGIGVFSGSVRKLTGQRVPQIGWNSVEDVTDSLITSAGLRVAYFANSFVCEPADSSVAVAWTTHDGDRFPSAVRRGSTVGVQFHPEKSSGAGLRFVRAFLDEVRG
jgi:imidazole glycerol-phosphate synthase subunit HisH